MITSQSLDIFHCPVFPPLNNEAVNKAHTRRLTWRKLVGRFESVLDESTLLDWGKIHKLVTTGASRFTMMNHLTVDWSIEHWKLKGGGAQFSIGFLSLSLSLTDTHSLYFYFSLICNHFDSVEATVRSPSPNPFRSVRLKRLFWKRLQC